MGVTKQAARKRFQPKGPSVPTDLDGGDGFSRFTPRARNAVVAAHNEDHEALGHSYIGTEHILLALVEVEDDDGVLTALGVTKRALEEHLVAALTRQTRRA